MDSQGEEGILTKCKPTLAVTFIINVLGYRYKGLVIKEFGFLMLIIILIFTIIVLLGVL